ncbi:MAG: hypothetical protein JWO05_2201 [Gemmatimonadetes bacterium]|nr:hypothetical protein [Gemmatimonadota bacterium]
MRNSILLTCLLLAMPLRAQSPLPFAIGERLTYQTRATGGMGGKAELWIEGPAEVRGVPVMVLNFAFSTGFGPLKVSDRTTSWLDPVRFASMRFHKAEQRFVAHHNEERELEPAALDELSFIYLVRTLELPLDSPLVLRRHFDEARNPTVLTYHGLRDIETPMGWFRAREVEMRVRDARNYDGEGVIRFWISDDACRRPVRIESRVPRAGSVVMTLREASPARAECAARQEKP